MSAARWLPTMDLRLWADAVYKPAILQQRWVKSHWGADEWVETESQWRPIPHVYEAPPRLPVDEEGV